MIEQQVGAFKRQVSFEPGYDWRRNGDAKPDYGIGSMLLWFILIGELGAVHWQAGTEWFPESARRHLANFNREQKHKPQGWHLGYHSKTPHYEGQKERRCECLPEGKCYADGSYMHADYLIEGFLNGGDDWVWNRLEAYYESVFHNKEFPNFDPIIVPHPDDRPSLS